MVWKMVLPLEIPWEDTCMASSRKGSVSSPPGTVTPEPRVKLNRSVRVPADLRPVLAVRPDRSRKDDTTQHIL